MEKKANKTKSTSNPVGSWWGRGLLALILLGLSYGFASLAIDSGSLIQYGLSIVALYLGLANFFRAGRLVLFK